MKVDDLLRPATSRPDGNCLGEGIMVARWSKSRRRDVSSQRHFHQVSGRGRVATPRGVSPVAPPKRMAEPERIFSRPPLRLIETKKIMRLEGDSIAYFWALETETAISYETLTTHWRDFVSALIVP